MALIDGRGFWAQMVFRGSKVAKLAVHGGKVLMHYSLLGQNVVSPYFIR